jgi:phosphohistidine phosphatase
VPANRFLYLLRHAKSSWDDPGLEDHERPLAPRGRRAVAVLAEHVRSAGITPDLVLCSSARRTQETLEGVDPAGERVIEPVLYLASPGELLARLQELPESIGSAMLVGHNPAVQVLSLRLADPETSHEAELADIQRKFPTGGLATLTFAGSWRDLAPGGARLVAYVRPKQLEGR